MTSFVCTVDMGITGRTALVTTGNNIIRNHLTSTIVKNKILSNKLVVQALIFYLSRIFNDTAFKLVYPFKPLVFEIGTCFFTTDTYNTLLNFCLTCVLTGLFR